MNVATLQESLESNQRGLAAEVARVRVRLEARSACQVDGRPNTPPDSNSYPDGSARCAPVSTRLDSLCEAFGLSAFERQIVLLCVGLELDACFAPLCGSAQGDSSRAYPTFSLALDVLAEPHWSAVAPAGPLRHWRLIEIGPGDSLTTSRLRIDERTLHFLTGVDYLDERLQGLLAAVPPPDALPMSFRAHAERIQRLWSLPADERPVIQLDGDARGGKRMLAAAVSKVLGLHLHELRASDIPSSVAERETLSRLWEREAVLSGSVLLIDLDDSAAARAAQTFADSLRALLFVTGGAGLSYSQRSVVRFDVDRPTAEEQRALWNNALGPLAPQLRSELSALVAQFPLDLDAIERAGRTLLADASPHEEESLADRLWRACRSQARRPLDRLAQRMDSSADWRDLVLPDESLRTLREIAAHVRQRARVYDTWGFAARGSRGLGLSALFAGPSGTGKTLAAEVLARELGFDLFRIDLSQVVSKYIGETEKNLSAVFDAAEQAGAILLFDEADALFGKRSEVKDSHDRYANIEVSYLLQRMEAYRGLAILTTNQRGALDTAFLRRLRFVVAFPFPDAVLRERIWERVFPVHTPTVGLDFAKLARLGVTGGNIRNIALNAAFLAADAGEVVHMKHLLHAARSECAKIEKAVTSAEIGGWI